MPRVFKRASSKKLYIAYTKNGREVYESARTEDQSEAERLLARRVQEQKDALGPIWDKVVEKFLATGHSPEAIQCYRASAADMHAHFHGMRADQITVTTLHNYMLQRRQEGIDEASISADIKFLSAVFGAWPDSDKPIH